MKRSGEAVTPHLFTDALGRAWRVFDTVFGVPPASPGKSVRVPLGDPRASSRVFVPIDPADHATSDRGVRLYRCYNFVDDDRGTDDGTLEQQLRHVGFWDPRPLAEIQAKQATLDAGRAGG